MITKFKLFESHGSGPAKELVDQLGYDFIEEYWQEHLAYTDVDEILQLWPSMVWNHIDDERAMNDIIYDEKNSLGVDDLEYEIKDYINGKYVTDEQREEIYDKYIDSEVDLEELEDLKQEYKEETDEIEKKKLRKKIRKKNKRIKEIRELDLDELLDEMSDDDLKDVIRDIFDEEEFVETVVEERYRGMSLQDYVEEIYGKTDDITFSSSYSNKRGDWDWILQYVDDDAVIEEYNNNESYDYKEERVQEEIYRTTELQEKLLKKKKRNALLLYDLFVNEPDDDQISDTYEFQKRYIQAYAKRNRDNTMAKAEALKNLYDNFGLDSDIEEEYSDYMHYVYADKFNL